MTRREFYEKVKMMRKAQKEGNMGESKLLENEIDKEIERVEAILAKNPMEARSAEIINQFENRGIRLHRI